MKGMNFLKKALCVVTVILTLLNTAILPVSALYRGVLGDVYYAHSRQIGAGVDLTLYESVTDGLTERAYVFEYRPDEGSLPIVSFGDTLVGSNRTSSLANAAIKNGQNVVAGINGDFYSVYTGIPMGALISGGRIISDDDKNNAVGFTYDGNTLFGDPQISFTVLHTYEKPVVEENNESYIQDEDDYFDEDEDFEPSDDFKHDRYDSDFERNEDDLTYETVEEYLPVSYFNKYPTEWGAYLLDDIFDASTRSSKASLEIVIEPDSKKMVAKANETIYGTVIEINNEATNTEIPEGCFVISVCETSAYRANYDSVSIGDLIEIEFQVADGWEDVETAIGGSDLIVTDGKVNNDAINESHEKIAHPRTAVGVREDGTVIFFAVDGRSDESYGFRLVSLAKTLISFGCVTALNLDGGGSTTAVVKFPGEETARVVNTPSDSGERSVANALLLVAPSESDGMPKYIIPDVTDPVILPNETYSFEGKFYDSSMSEVYDDTLNELDVELSFDYSRLSYYNDEDLPNLGSISEDGKIYTADGITGEIPLLFKAEYDGEELTGRVILFVAPAPDSAEVLLGGVVYSSGESVPVEFEAYYMNKPVPARPEHLTYTLTDNEIRTEGIYKDDAPKFADSSLGYISADGEFVPYDKANGSVWLTVSLDSIPVSQTLIAVGDPYITVIENETVYYDFSASSSVVSEEIIEKSTNDTDFESDTLVTEQLEEQPMTVSIDDIVYESDLPLDNALSLDIYADDSELSLYAKVIDFEGNEHTVKYIKQVNEPDNNDVYHYRAKLGGKYSALDEILSLSAETNAGKTGKLNITKAQISFSDTETVFYDTHTHWARTNINTLYHCGIIGGEEYGGKLRFAPDRNLSRAEFAVMISKSLGYNVSDYTKELKFDDSNKIAAWAEPFVRAVSENGIMNGKSMSDGSLYFDPEGKITRQEIMQVIGNIIKADKEQALIDTLEAVASEDFIADEIIEEDLLSSYNMPQFSDVSDIAPWAYDNVLLTLEAGIITGYNDNTLKPLRNVTRAEAATVILRYMNYSN